MLSASGLESRVVMSLKMMPGFGKSGMFLMLPKIISFSSVLNVIILFDFLIY